MDALWQFCTARFSIEFHAVDEDLAPEDIAYASSGKPAAWFAAFVVVRDIKGAYCGRRSAAATDSFERCPCSSQRLVFRLTAIPAETRESRVPSYTVGTLPRSVRIKECARR